MKIIIVTSIFPPEIGGPATYSYHLANSLVKNHKVAVITFSNQKNSQAFKTISVSKSGNTLIRQWRLLKAIWSESEDCTVIYSQDPLVVGLTSALVAVMRKRPLVVKFVGDIVWETARNTNRFTEDLESFYRSNLSFPNRIKVAIQGWVLNRAAQVIVPSKYLRRFLKDQYEVSEKKVKLIYNGIEIKTQTSVKRDTKLAVTVARLVPWKGIGAIVEAVKDIANLKYYIAGSGPEEKSLETKIKEFELEGRVKLLGALDGQAVAELLQKTTYFILNSSYEGLPHVLLEAAGYQDVIVAPDLPGVKEIFSEQETWSFEPGSKESLQHTLKKAVQNHKLSQSKAKRAYKKVVGTFSWENTYQKTEQLLNRVSQVAV